MESRLDQIYRLEQLGRRVARMPGVWRLRVLQQLARMGVKEEMLLIVMAGAVGVSAAGAASLFEWVLEFLQTHYFEALVERFHLTGKWIFLLPLLPAVGGLAVSVVRVLFHRAHSTIHGLSSVLLSLIRDRGRLRPMLGLETLLTSGLTIGTGGSAGPEAPIAIIGSSVGSIVASLAGISRVNSATLIGCGAAAGIAAVFDAPIAGILFALEVMLRDFSVKTFTPIVISAVLSVTTFHALDVREHAQIARGLFELPVLVNVNFAFHEFPNFLLLGLVCGLLAIFLTWLMEGITHLFEKQKRLPTFWQPAIGAGLSGICGMAYLLLFARDGHLVRPKDWYVPIFAGGYPTMMQLLDPHTYLQAGNLSFSFVALLLCLCMMKIVATSFTLGGGGAGGVFAPALFIGSTAGAALGVLLHPYLHGVQPSVYALVGMGSILAAVIQAPLMGIILLFELTRNYQVMLPIMLSAVTATVIFRAVMRESIYTIALTKMGVRSGSAVGLTTLRRYGLDQLPLLPASIARPGQTLAEIVARSQMATSDDYVVLDNKDEYLGVLSDQDVRSVMLAPESAPLLLVGEVMRTNVPPLKATDSLEVAWDLFAQHDVDRLAVIGTTVAQKGIIGMIARSDLMRRYHDELGG